MARLILVSIGKVNGVDAYAPLDKEDEKLTNNRNTLVLETMTDKSARTALQNRSLHLYCTHLAETLNNSGWDMKKVLAVLSKAIDIPWSGASVKEKLWRPVQKAMLEKLSTTKLETQEVGQVYQTLSKLMAEHFRVDVAWPDRYRQAEEQYAKKAKRAA